MLDFGWAELLVVMAVAVLVVGPNEIPGLMRGFGRVVRRLQYMKYAFSQQFDDFMQEGDLDDIRKSVNFEARDFDEEAADDEDFIEPIEPIKSIEPETLEEVKDE